MEKITKFLDDNNFDYIKIKHKPTLTVLPPIQEVVELGFANVKNLMLTTSNKQEVYYMVCAPVTKQFKTNVIAKQIGSSRLTFVTEEYLNNKLLITPGFVSILNLISGDSTNLTVIIDEDLLKEKRICFPPNRDDYMYAFNPNDVLKILELLNLSYRVIRIDVS